MAMTAAEIMYRASIILQDAGAVRWPAPELAQWLSDAQREIALHKPTAFTAALEFDLVAGSRQEVDDTVVSLIAIRRNLDPGGTAGSRAGRQAIRMVDRSVLDNQIPGWTDPTVLPAYVVVDHAVHDPLSNPRVFYVAPPNDGTGVIEIEVCVLPDDIANPALPLIIANYTHVRQAPEVFRTALVDFVCYRAFSKDSTVPQSGQRAIAHYQQFANAVGLKMRGDGLMNPDTTASG